MKAVAIAFAVLSLLSGALTQVTLNTPSNPVVCQPLQLVWSGGLPPYFISVQDGDKPSGLPLFQFEEQSGNDLIWAEVNFRAGTNLAFLLRDSNGAISQTASVRVQSGASTSCLSTSGPSSERPNTTQNTIPPTSTSTTPRSLSPPSSPSPSTNSLPITGLTFATSTSATTQSDSIFSEDQPRSSISPNVSRQTSMASGPPFTPANATTPVSSSSSATPSPAVDPGSGNSALHPGAIAGIVIGSTIFFGGCLWLIWYQRLRRQKGPGKLASEETRVDIYTTPDDLTPKQPKGARVQRQEEIDPVPQQTRSLGRHIDAGLVVLERSASQSSGRLPPAYDSLAQFEGHRPS